MRVQNPSAKVLTQRRAGNAGQAIVADTRHKIVAPRKGAGSYRRAKANRYAAD